MNDTVSSLSEDLTQHDQEEWVTLCALYIQQGEQGTADTAVRDELIFKLAECRGYVPESEIVTPPALIRRLAESVLKKAKTAPGVQAIMEYDRTLASAVRRKRKVR